MTPPAVSIVLLVPAVLLVACQGLMQGDTMKSADRAETIRNQGYALLYSTLDDESQLDQVLIVKDPATQVADLIKSIAHFSRYAKDRLQAFADEDPTLRLGAQGLPEVELQTRDSISGATSKQIIFSGGKEFEFRILLTQHEALNYITHLAGTLSKTDTHEARTRYVAQLAEDSKALHERVIALLQAPYVGSPK